MDDLTRARRLPTNSPIPVNSAASREVTLRPAALFSAIAPVSVVGFWLMDFHCAVQNRDAFTWMDPSQYFTFAQAVASGRAHPLDFGIPTIFPFFIVPLLKLSPVIPAALWVNAGGMLILVAALHLLRRQLKLRAPLALLVMVVLSSPLLLGLSRELYVEFFLTGVAAFALWLWLSLLEKGGLLRATFFGAAVFLGFLTKITFPVFVVLPVAGAVIGRLTKKRWKSAGLLLAAAVLPVTLMICLASLLFPRALQYYRTVGNTTLPTMYLIGPTTLVSWNSATYYLREIVLHQLWLLTPCALVAFALVWRSGVKNKALDGPTAALGLWFVGPLVLFTFEIVKEPRHVAPVVVPAVLLIIRAFDRLPNLKARFALLSATALVALVQYGVITRTGRSTPYLVDHAYQHEKLLASMQVPGESHALEWKVNRNLAVSGFTPNEALALTWRLFPGVTYDLDTMTEPNSEGSVSP